MLVASLDQRSRAEAIGVGDRHAGPQRSYAKVAAHCEILMFAPLTIAPQRAISSCSIEPKASGEPPAGSTPILASAVRTFSLLTALSIAPLRRRTISDGVPAFTSMPAQS